MVHWGRAICGKNVLEKEGGTLDDKIEGQIYEMKIFMDGGDRGSDPVGQYVFFHFTPFIIYF